MGLWYYKVNGSRFGPCSLDEMWDLIAKGTIKPTTIVWAQDMTEWLPAGKSGLAPLFIEEIFQKSETVQPPPIRKPPEGEEPVLQTEAVPVETVESPENLWKKLSTRNKPLSGDWAKYERKTYAEARETSTLETLAHFKQKMTRNMYYSTLSFVSILYFLFYFSPNYDHLADTFQISILFYFGLAILYYLPCFFFARFFYLCWIEIPSISRPVSPMLLAFGVCIHPWLAVVVNFYFIHGLARTAFPILREHYQGSLGREFKLWSLLFCLAYLTHYIYRVIEVIIVRDLPDVVTIPTELVFLVSLIALIVTTRRAGVALREINLAQAAEQTSASVS